ncbi:hypothetical protein BH23CHL9_BH23CHL9_12650 [soil metagenome]
MSRADRILVAAGGGALVLAIAAAWVMLAPAAGEDAPDPNSALLLGTPVASASASSAAPTVSGSTTIIVDLQGAVAEPGIRELPAGSRVGDAIAAAGGYASDADLAAAAASINLAQPLVDGAQISVPRIGEAVAVAPGASAPPAPGGSGSGSGSTGGLVNLNTATPEELEALPGIGPVTVQKIVAARQERPFTSLDDAVARGVIHRGQLEDIKAVATAS